MFHFKQFSIDQSGCAMKINTDGVLLGALADADEPKQILDIGTGTGIIALMLTQRFPKAYIDGIEVDKSTADTGQSNFANSPFAERLALHEVSFQNYFQSHPNNKYDLIVSNPPFYINSLQSPGAAKNLAKHADINFFSDLIAVTSGHLNTDGLFWLILPITTAGLVKKLATIYQLYLQQIINIKSYPTSQPHREVLVFGLQQIKTAVSDFIIYNEPKQYSEIYENALNNFFTIFSS